MNKTFPSVSSPLHLKNPLRPTRLKRDAAPEQTLVRMIPLADWARLKGIHYITAWKWFKRGKMPVHAEQMPSGMILVQTDGDMPPPVDAGEVWVYARVNTRDDSPTLDAQVDAARAFAAARGWSVAGVVGEQQAGESLSRPRLCALFGRRPRRIIAWDPSRIARLNLDLIEQGLIANGTELVFLNYEPIEAGLMSDLIEVIRHLLRKRWGVKKRALLFEYLSKAIDPFFRL
jgi:putative resolvase